MGVEYARISAMLRGRRSIRTLDLPWAPNEEEAEVIEVGVRILLDDEIDDARLDAVQYVQGRAKARRLDLNAMLAVDPEIVDREITRQLIFRAFVQPKEDLEKKDHLPFFPAPQAVRQLDSVMVETLFETYIDQQNYVNPLRTIDEDEARELVDALGKEHGAEVILSQYDAPSLRSLLHTLAVLLRASRPGKSATGSPPAMHS